MQSVGYFLFVKRRLKNKEKPSNTNSSAAGRKIILRQSFRVISLCDASIKQKSFKRLVSPRTSPYDFSLKSAWKCKKEASLSVKAADMFDFESNTIGFGKIIQHPFELL